MSHGGVPVGSQRLDLLLSCVRKDVARLSLAAVPLVGALASVEDGLPDWFRHWLMAELDQRVPLDVVTPAAEAVMRIREFGRYAEMDFSLKEIEAQYALLLALDQVDNMYQAVDFMSQLARHLEVVLKNDDVPNMQNKET